MRVLVFWVLLSPVVVRSGQCSIPACDHPVFCHGELLETVQTLGVFNDSKQFVDMPLIADPEDVLGAFNNWTDRSKEGMKEFVSRWFEEAGSDIQEWTPVDWTSSPQFISKLEDAEVREWAGQLNMLWLEFGRKVAASVKENPSWHSLLPVDYPFIVPGGRFREFYYWDSYWIMEGLLLCEMNNTVQDMIENLVQMVEWYGLVPNGGRVYYTRRSQPPLLTQMVVLYYEKTDDWDFVQRVLPILDEEYKFWLENRTVADTLCGGCKLSHYAADTTEPRPESYLEDVETASHVPAENQSLLFSNLASGAESGWDFSSRWFSDSGPFAGQLPSIQTKNIIPVDLNSILCQNEMSLEMLHRKNGSVSKADDYATARKSRQTAMEKFLWDEEAGLWSDWDLATVGHSPDFYASSLFPLYWGCGPVNVSRHKLVLQTLQSRGVLDCTGVPTSLTSGSGQQWDYPNVWAPLVWIPVMAWSNSTDSELSSAAESIAESWLSSVYSAWVAYNNTMFEKYNCSGGPGTGGEYTVQAGFGWTNGVALQLMNTYPGLVLTEKSTLTWLAAVILPVAVLIMIAACCTCWCCWLYRHGEQRYWARVRNTHLLYASAGKTQLEDKSPVLENMYVEDYDSSTENQIESDLSYRKMETC